MHYIYWMCEDQTRGHVFLDQCFPTFFLATLHVFFCHGPCHRSFGINVSSEGSAQSDSQACPELMFPKVDQMHHGFYATQTRALHWLKLKWALYFIRQEINVRPRVNATSSSVLPQLQAVRRRLREMALTSDSSVHLHSTLNQVSDTYHMTLWMKSEQYVNKAMGANRFKRAIWSVIFLPQKTSIGYLDKE